jgi:DNA-binding transcriptional MerR regulator
MDSRSDQTHTIGEFARRTGLSERALRLYEGRGLLAPAFVDPATGYRHYTEEQVSVGLYVAMLRSIEMPLAEIQRVIEAPVTERAELVAHYWYGVERALDGRRHTVRRLRSIAEEEEYGMSRAETVVLEGREHGAFAAVAALAAIQDPSEAAESYAQSMKTVYWEEKDLPLVVAIAYAGVGRLLGAADMASDEEAYELRSRAKGLMYDLASFSWPGWDEPDVEIGPSDAVAGLAAARSNLAMAVQLEKGDLATSRAHWMLGGHLLTSGEPSIARQEFAKARELAERAGASAEVELSTAFDLLAALAAGDEAAEARLRVSLERLSQLDEFFVGQVETARAVLGL